jgi:hypothetical protein
MQRPELSWQLRSLKLPGSLNSFLLFDGDMAAKVEETEWRRKVFSKLTIRIVTSFASFRYKNIGHAKKRKAQRKLVTDYSIVSN